MRPSYDNLATEMLILVCITVFESATKMKISFTISNSDVGI